MKPKTLDTQVTLKLPSELHTEASTLAAKAYTPLTQWIRQAMREKAQRETASKENAR